MQVRRLTRYFVLLLVISGILFTFPVFSQETPKKTVSDNVIDRILTFVHSAANIVGKGLVELINVVAGIDVSELQQPLGYLGILTASLIVFGAIKAAQKVVWFVVLLGWGLMIVRIVLEALGRNPGG